MYAIPANIRDTYATVVYAPWVRRMVVHEPARRPRVFPTHHYLHTYGILTAADTSSTYMYLVPTYRSLHLENFSDCRHEEQASIFLNVAMRMNATTVYFFYSSTFHNSYICNCNHRYFQFQAGR